MARERNRTVADLMNMDFCLTMGFQWTEGFLDIIAGYGSMPLPQSEFVSKRLRCRRASPLAAANLRATLVEYRKGLPKVQMFGR